MKKGFKYRPTFREGFGFKYASTRKVNTISRPFENCMGELFRKSFSFGQLNRNIKCYLFR